MHRPVGCHVPFHHAFRRLGEELKEDEAITDTLLLTVSNQFGVAYNVHVIAVILTHVAPALGRRPLSQASQDPRVDSCQLLERAISLATIFEHHADGCISVKAR